MGSVLRVYLNRWLIAFAVLLSVAGAMLVSLERPQRRQASTKPVADRDIGSAKIPLRLEPSIRLRGTFAEARVTKALDRLRHGVPTSLSNLLHMLRVFGSETSISDPKTSKNISGLDLALDFQKSLDFFERPTLIDTRTGVRCRVATKRGRQEQHERQAHHDQLLAVLGELCVPLNTPISTAGGTRTVEAILDDSLANFDLKEKEIEWSALAFALYLPPQATWVDKFDRVHSFDDVAAELMRRPFDAKLSCGGTHLLFTLAVMLRVDEATPIFSPSVRGEIRAHLGEIVLQVESCQSAAGFWQPDWYRHADSEKPVRVATLVNSASWPQVLATGHHLEWLMLLPPDLLPSQECFLRGARWLHERLLNDPNEVLTTHYCPYSHAGRVLMLLTETEFPERPVEPSASSASQDLRSGRRFADGHKPQSREKATFHSRATKRTATEKGG